MTKIKNDRGEWVEELGCLGSVERIISTYPKTHDAIMNSCLKQVLNARDAFLILSELLEMGWILPGVTEGKSLDKDFHHAELRKLLCNGTNDCENSPDCPENSDGCIVDEIIKLFTDSKTFTVEEIREKLLKIMMSKRYGVINGHCITEMNSKDIVDELIKKLEEKDK